MTKPTMTIKFQDFVKFFRWRGWARIDSPSVNNSKKEEMYHEVRRALAFAAGEGRKQTADL